MRLPTLLLSADTFERHALTARLARPFAPQTVLDVGGARGGLARFLRGPAITSANVDASGDLQYDGRVLPFAGASFDLVTAIDVLEHLPSAQRGDLIDEIARVARLGFILAAPLGTPYHVEVEQRAARLFADDNRSDMRRFLREHLDNGLPTLRELEALLGPYEHALLFAGDCREALARAQRGRGLRRRLARWGRPGAVLEVALAGNWLRQHRLTATPEEYTNRCYAVCRVRPSSGPRAC